MTDFTVYATAEEWLRARKRRLTSSDVGGLIGCYASKKAAEKKNPYAVWLDKTTEEIEEPDADWRRRFEAGHHMEPLVARWLEEDTGLTLYDPGDYAMVERGVLAATPDRFILGDGLEEEGLAEFKTDGIMAAPSWQESGKFDHAVVQLTVALHCAGLSEGWIATIFGMGLDFQVYPVALSEDLVSLIVERAEEFWEYVLTGTPPPAKYLDDSEAIGQSLRKIYAKDTGATIALPPAEHEALLVEYQEIQEQAKELRRREQEVKNKVMHAMGDASYGEIEGSDKKWSWKTTKRDGYTVAPTEYRALNLVNK